MSNKLRQFQSILNEGISQEDLADTLINRLQMRYPDIIDKYGYDAVESAVDDVASFHAGAEELGSSDISIMLKEIIKQLDSSSQGVAEASFMDPTNPLSPMNPINPANPINVMRMAGPSGESAALAHNIGYAIGMLGALIGLNASSIAERAKKIFKSPGTTNLPELEKCQKQIAELHKKTKTLKSERGVQKARDELKLAYEELERIKAKIASGVVSNPYGSVNEAYTQSPEELKRIAQGWAAKHPNIDDEIAAAEKAYDPYYQYASGPTYSRGKQASEHLRYLKSVKNIIDSGLGSEGVAEGLGTPYPGTYEQENNRFKSKGPRQTQKIAFEAQVNELSTEKLAQYKTASAKDASIADKAGDFKRGDKRFSGIVKATKKQFDNDAKQVKESSIMKGLRNAKN